MQLCCDIAVGRLGHMSQFLSPNPCKPTSVREMQPVSVPLSLAAHPPQMTILSPSDSLLWQEWMLPSLHAACYCNPLKSLNIIDLMITNQSAPSRCLCCAVCGE